ncbi:UPF0179 family protein [Methanobrevibacter curvatus]|uniref:UPF0179 protein MBCUR_06540 n=1 Tax=Methanobrevibacter curvatus TaxID=49547 RepID=A0A166C1L2_9EURY|nr:UPF0179 family protein [Methanobrevibacter curvatus]KZX14036.1 hypothetical protein MBCUR_06540 [Methanobrevibacter curvatus]
MITLIGTHLAKKDLVFLFNGPAEECEECKFKAPCLGSLEEGRSYIINNVRDNKQNCLIHDGGFVLPVEVEKADIVTNVSSKKCFEGSSIVYDPPDCDLQCVYRPFCFPEGLKEGDKTVIKKVLEKRVDGCAKGLSLSKVVLKI